MDVVGRLLRRFGGGADRQLRKVAGSSGERFPLSVTARMWEYIEPVARGLRYEDPLDAFLVREDLGEIDGGGSLLGDRPQIQYVDVTFWLRNSDEALAKVASRLGELGAPLGSELQYERNGRMSSMPFGATECIAVFLDGVSLPHEVYERKDVNQVVAHMNHALDSLGEFRSHWRGPEETALFFYGADADAMKEAGMPVLSAEPLCQNAEVILRYGRHPKGSAEFRIPLQRS